VNNDNQAKLKTGQHKVFQDENYRMKIVSSLRVVDEVFLSIDQD
jgi:glycerol-3-phosphate cytidylyltransferase-like family protein